MKTYCIGDIHGGYKALIQCLEKSNFNKEKDTLICLGDVADGYPEVPECFEELLSIKNLVYIMGNHDWWLLQYFKFLHTPHIWTSQGGKSTLKSYEALKNMMDFEQIERHTKLLEEAKDYYILNDNLFVHGGINWKVPVDEQSLNELMWDRHMWVTVNMWHNNANTKRLKIDSYKNVFIGHTTTSYYDKSLKPMKACNVWNLDQGAGYEGKLTIMNVNTEEYFQSDLVSELYPNEKGR